MSSARTKNRLREHPDAWWTGEWSFDVFGLEGRACGLFESNDDWMGWLDLKEVEKVRGHV